MKERLLFLSVCLSALGCAAQALTLWTPNHWEMLSDETRPDDGPPRVLMVGGRNGQASGLIAARGQDILQDPRVEVSGLQHESGAVMPADFITIRYGSQHHRDTLGEENPSREGDYFHLSTSPLATTRTLLARLTAQIPPTAPAGMYQGQATVRARGVAPQSVPVTLMVGKGVLPDPVDYVSHVNFLHSPDSVALRYGVPFWSDAHWEKLEASHAVLRALGQSVLHVPVILRSETAEGDLSNYTHFGSREGVIRFRQGGGGHEPDFSVLEQFLLHWRDRVNEPQFIVLYLWDISFANHERDTPDGMKAVVTGVNDRGETESITLPYPGEPGSEELWNEVVAGVRERVARLGWNPNSVLIGIAHDRKPVQRTLEFWNKVAPGIQWNVISHMRGYGIRDGEMNIGDMRVAYHEFPWNPQPPENLGNGILGGWNSNFPVATLARFHHRGSETALGHRWLAEGTVGQHGTRNRVNQIGPARFKIEHWGVPQTDSRGNTNLHSIFNMSGWVNLMRNHTTLGTAGPNGLEPSVFLLNHIESVQDVEARIAIEQLLTWEGAGFPDDLVERARTVLRERSRFIHHNRSTDPRWQGLDGFNPQEHAHRMYEVLGELQESAAGGAR